MRCACNSTLCTSAVSTAAVEHRATAKEHCSTGLCFTMLTAEVAMIVSLLIVVL